MKEFVFGNFSEELYSSINKIKQVIKSGDNKLFEDFSKKIEEISGSKNLKVSFVGQYSAGKSTIIKALTGNNAIKIDADIATDVTEDYEWNGIILTDTPGLYTDRKDHDEKTLQKIKESDLLVYCLTSDLFDNIILENFINLAFKQEYKTKMMIVVNKMSMEAGEYEKLVRNYKITLQKSLNPYKFDDFKSSFIDAADYLEGVEIKEDLLIKVSKFEDLINNLNSFVETNGMNGKLETPVRFSISTIDEYIAAISNNDNKELFQIIRRLEDLIHRSSRNAKRSSSDLVESLINKIRGEANHFINNIGNNNIDIKEQAEILEAFINKETKKAHENFDGILQESFSNIQNEANEVFESDMWEYVVSSINSSDVKFNSNTKESLNNYFSKFDAYVDAAKKVSSFTKNGTFGTTSNLLFKSTDVSGSIAHSTIKSVGNFFGYKFAPWESIGLAKNIANFGGIIAIAGVIFDIFSFISEISTQDKIKNAKKECYSTFITIYSDIEKSFESRFNEFSNGVYGNILNETQDLRLKLNSSKNHNDMSISDLIVERNKLNNILKQINSK